FDEHGTQDPYQWTFDHPEHEHFVLYHGAEIVGYAHIQLWPEIVEATPPIIIVTEENLNRGFGTQFLVIIEEWLTVHDYKILHVETSGKPMSFYKKHGYAEMPVEDLHLNKCDTTLGKELK
ncbi:MAG: GNAT family N-acetyltransferase, partial [Puniceicoccales bacterium]|nr:GNAT family N-acetyltransferase [Puniceicoccales bacterium]